MMENKTYSPTSVLYGWKETGKDIHNGVIDPSMGKNPLTATEETNGHGSSHP